MKINFEDAAGIQMNIYGCMHVVRVNGFGRSWFMQVICKEVEYHCQETC